MARGARRRRGARRARPRPASARARRRPRPADGCGAGAGRHHALHQHDPATTRARVPGRRGARAARALAHALERDRDGAQGEQGILRARRAHRELPVGGGPLRDRLQPLLERALRQPRRRPRLHAGPLVAGHLRSRVPRGAADRGAAGGLPTGGLAQRAAVVPASVADARLLAVPDRLDGARADHGHLPGPVHEVPRRARGRRHRGAQGLGLPGRRRDRRARVAGRDLAGGPRAARQPHLRHQLQPAAPGRPGARQREDHPGARDGVPGLGLERHQGGVGLALGRAAGARPRRPAAGADGGGRRRRLPDLQVARRRLRARALLRDQPGAAGDGGRHERRGGVGAQPRRPGPAQGLRRLQGGRRAHRPADGDPRQDHQGLRDGGGGRRPEHHPPAEEDDRARAAGLPRPLRPAPLRRAGRRHEPLPPAGGLAGDDVPARAARRAGRVAAGAAPSGRCPARARAVGLRVPAHGHRRPRGLHHDGLRPGALDPAARQAHRAATSCRSCPTSRAPSAWRACSASSGSSPRSASSTRQRTPSS